MSASISLLRRISGFTVALSTILLHAIVGYAAIDEHKVIAQRGTIDGAPGVQLWHDYGAFALYKVPDSTLQSMSAVSRSRLRIADEMDRLEISAHPFDTQRDRLSLPADLTVAETSGAMLHLVQFVGPIKQSWLDQVEATGGQSVQYIANNGYLLLVDDAARQALDSLVSAGEFLQYSAPLPPAFKIGPALRTRLEGKEAPRHDRVVPVVIQMVRHPLARDTEHFVAARATRIESEWTPILRFQNVHVTVRLDDVKALARRPDINWIEERLPRELHDEVQGQIIAGNFDGGMTGPSGPGYHTFLDNLGFSQNPAGYPVVDVTDDGIGNGTVNSGDPTLYEGGSLANPTRLSYVANCTAAADGGGPDGHGHLNTSIAGGFDSRTGFPFQDPQGFQRGLGMNPYGRFAGTRIFGPSFDLSACGGTDTGLIQSEQNNGAQISTNSWGCSGCAGTYDDASQAFDVGVRDADLTEPGNQPITFVFSSGNAGPGSGTVGTPGNGKNMITVGASENDRPSDEDGSWTDGCGVGPSGADNAMDIISFSSRGPSPGNRVKPELIAPGTHIQGTASTNSAYNGSGVCDQYRPSAQTTFAASSGTSYSTPAVAGVASLAWWWLENAMATNSVIDGVVAAPSPAMMKAYLMAHPTYLTGVSANDTLPSNSQGYGMPNLGELFDNTSKSLLDQAVIFNNSGEAWTWNGAVADPARPVRITMAYTDAAGAIGTSPQVNDLNLAADVGGTSYLGNVFSGQWSVTGGSADLANNYEAIFLPAGTSGAVEITVTGFNIAGDGVPNTGDGTDQDFAVVCYNCAQQPTFTLAVSPPTRSICTPANALYDVDVGSVLGFSNPVTLSVSGEPAGTTAGFSVNPVTPPGASLLTIGNTGSAAPGTYSLEVTGTSSTTQMKTVGLDVFTAMPAAPTLLTPANGATSQPTTPTFTWTTVGGTYTIQIATDAGFTNVVDSASDLSSATYTPGTDLNTSTTYFWRVWADNACGTGPISATWSFTTEAAPGDCDPGTSPQVHFFDDLESGATGWTHSGTGDTWMLSGSRTHSGTGAFWAANVPSVSDQYLVSPPIDISGAGDSLTLQFWNYQSIESGTGGCFDGAVLEYSDDGGGSWIRLESELVTDPYHGVISTLWSNPLGGENAWCGDPQNWLESVVDLDALALRRIEGDTVQFRFRLATDESVDREGWYVDDVLVQSCGSVIFADGFESGDTSAWSTTVP